MTYLLLCTGFVAVAVVAALLLRRPGGPPPAALALAGVVLLLLTATFDNLMIAAGLFAYSEAHLSGLSVGAAPIEDFTYPLAALVLLPALWSRIRRHDDR